MNQFNLEAKFEADVAKFIKNVNDAHDALVDLEGADTDKIEKSLVDITKEAENLAKTFGVVGKSGTKMGNETSSAVDKARAGLAKYNIEVANLQKNQTGGMSVSGLNLDSSKWGLADQKAKVEGVTQSLNSQRYALYDIARTWGVVGAATTGALAVAGKITVDYEKNFANVLRTTEATGEAAQQLRADLVDLTTQIPQTFGDVTSIASLAGQLGIANEAVADFTETVAKFSATTGVSVQTSAESLGRLAELAGVPQTEFENLGSAILKTGINAVATEGQILSIATQISTSGNLAGFAAHEVVALASAFASLGVQPERARGTMQRVFANIDTAVGASGEQLEKFASVSNLTVEQFSDAWKNRPQEAFSAFINGLSGVADSGQDTNAFLKDLGIYAVRDIQAMQVLANNTNVYADALADSASGYRDATQLSESYGITAETVAAKLVVLKNTITAIIDALGGQSKGVLSTFVDLLQNVASVIKSVADNKAAGIIFGVVAAIAALVAGMAGYMAMTAIATASSYALTTAMNSGATSAKGGSGAIMNLTKQLFNLAFANSSATAATTGTTTALKGQAVAARTSTAAMGALRTSMMFTGAGIAIAAIAKTIEVVAKSLESAESKAEKFFGSYSGLTAAIRADTEAGSENEKIYRRITTSTGEASSAQDQSAKSLAIATGAQEGLKDATAETNEEIKNQTLLIGDNAALVIKSTVAQDSDIKDIWLEQGAAIEASGFKLEKFIDLAIESSAKAEEYATGFRVTGEELEASFQKAADATGASKVELQNAYIESLKLDKSFGQLVDKLLLTDSALYSSASELNLMAAAGAVATDAIEDVGDGAEDAVSKVKELADATFDLVMSSANLEGAMSKLGASIYENGPAFSDMTEEGRSNLSALQSAVNALSVNAGEDMNMFGVGLIEMIAELQGAGVDTQNELGFLFDSLQQITGDTWGLDLDTSAARTDIRSFLDAAIKALEMRAELERQAYQAAQSSRFLQLSQTGVDPGDQSKNFPVGTFDGTIKALKGLRDSVNTTSTSAKDAGSSFKRGFGDAARKATDKAAKGAGKAAKAAKDAAKEFRTMADYIGDLEKVSSRAFQFRFGVQIAKDARSEAYRNLKEGIVTTLEDIDITGILAKRMGRRESRDTIKQTFFDLKQAAADAAQAVVDANLRIQKSLADLSGLKADKTVLNYQLGVAMNYGDTEREAVIRAELAKNAADQAAANAEAAKAAQDAKKASEAQNKSLKGNTQAAINNRNSVRGMVSGYSNYIQMLIDTGASEKTVSKAAKDAEADFMAQGRALGYNSDELATYRDTLGALNPALQSNTNRLTGNSSEAVTNRKAMQDLVQTEQAYIIALIESGASQKTVNAALADSKNRINAVAKELGISQSTVKTYTKSMDDLRLIINKIPKNLTVNTKLKNPAKKALDEFIRAYNNKTINLKTSAKAPGTMSGGQYRPSSVYSTGAANVASIYARGNATAKNLDLRSNLMVSGQPFLRKKDGGITPEYRSSGGEIGRSGFPGSPKGVDTVPIWSQPGEFMVKKKAVDHYGVPYMTALNKMQIPRTMSVPSSSGSGSNSNANSIQLVELVQSNIVAISRAVSTQINLDGSPIARSTNNYNSTQALRGSA